MLGARYTQAQMQGLPVWLRVQGTGRQIKGNPAAGAHWRWDGSTGTGPHLGKADRGGFPGGGAARLGFRRLGGSSLLVASNLGCSSGCDNHLLTDLPVAAFYKYTDDIYLFCFEGSVSCIKLSPVDFPVTGGDSLLRFLGEVLEGFCLDVGGLQAAYQTQMR